MNTMNIIYKYAMIFFILLLTGCNYLDYNEEDFYDNDMVFENFDRTKNILNNIYDRLPSGFNEVDGSMRAAATDDAIEAYSLSNVNIFIDGRWSPAQVIDAVWAHNYRAIRAANQLLNNYDISVLDDKRYNDNYPEMIKEYELFDDQARFLRAYFYFELMRRYGGVPLLQGSVLELDEGNTVKHNSFSEVVNFIVEECDALIDLLPVNYDNIPGKPNKGRATKGAAMALKARTLLYAASPLHNPANDLTKWEDAAAASYALIDSCNQNGWYTLDSDYSNVVNNFESLELIFGRRYTPSSSFERSNFPVGYQGALPGTCPTQNLVDTYEMVNGKDIDETGSLYNPDRPYRFRDSRLEKTILLNNTSWKDRNVEPWRGGLDGPPLERATRTGYYLKKYVDPNVSLDPNSRISTEHLWVFFRYGEILLNFAEAMNEAYGPTEVHEYEMSAVQAMDLIRSRAELPAYNGEMTQEAVRKEIREERRTELAFENHRFWDIRRWMIGEQTTTIMGMDITRNENGTFNYSVVEVQNRTWNEKYNLYPVPQTEIFKNSNLTQNPNW